MAAAAEDKLAIELLLQLLKRKAHGGLTHVQPLGRTRQAFLLGYDAKAAQEIPVEF